MEGEQLTLPGIEVQSFCPVGLTGEDKDKTIEELQRMLSLQFEVIDSVLKLNDQLLKMLEAEILSLEKKLGDQRPEERKQQLSQLRAQQLDRPFFR